MKFMASLIKTVINQLFCNYDMLLKVPFMMYTGHMPFTYLNCTIVVSNYICY